MIEAEWEDLRQTKSPHDICICYNHYFHLNLDNTCFLCNEGESRIIGGNDKPRHDKNYSDSRFSITILRVGSASGVNVPVIFIAKVKNLHLRIRGTNFPKTGYGNFDPEWKTKVSGRPPILKRHHLPPLEDSTWPTKTSSSLKNRTQFNTLPLDILRTIDMWHSGLVHHNNFKKLLTWLTHHNPFICYTMCYKLKFFSFKTLCITKLSVTRGQIDA